MEEKTEKEYDKLVDDLLKSQEKFTESGNPSFDVRKLNLRYHTKKAKEILYNKNLKETTSSETRFKLLEQALSDIMYDMFTAMGKEATYALIMECDLTDYSKKKTLELLDKTYETFSK